MWYIAKKYLEDIFSYVYTYIYKVHIYIYVYIYLVKKCKKTNIQHHLCFYIVCSSLAELLLWKAFQNPWSFPVHGSCFLGEIRLPAFAALANRLSALPRLFGCSRPLQGTSRNTHMQNVSVTPSESATGERCASLWDFKDHLHHSSVQTVTDPSLVKKCFCGRRNQFPQGV